MSLSNKLDQGIDLQRLQRVAEKPGRDNSLDALKMPDKAKLFGKELLSKFRGQDAQISYSLKPRNPGDPTQGVLNARILGRGRAGEIKIERLAGTENSTATTLILPAVDRNGEMRLFPDGGRNVQVAPLDPAKPV